VVALAAGEEIQPSDILYLNRLSDLLFVLARYANHLAGIGDVPWK
jgi:cob(I)alamin adenosyltransferase